MQGMALLEAGGLGQHQPPRQVRLHHHQDPAQIQHQPEEHDPAEAIEQLPGAAGIEHLTDGAVQGISSGPGEHLDAGGEPALGVAHGGLGLGSGPLPEGCAVVDCIDQNASLVHIMLSISRFSLSSHLYCRCNKPGGAELLEVVRHGQLGMKEYQPFVSILSLI